MEEDWELLRRYAGLVSMGTTLEQAKEMGFVTDAYDEAHFETAAKDPNKYMGAPDTEMVNGIHDMSVVDDIVTRLKLK